MRIYIILLIFLLSVSLDFYLYKVIIQYKKKWIKLQKNKFRNYWFGINIFIITVLFISIFVNIPFRLRIIFMVLYLMLFISKLVFTVFCLIDEIRLIFKKIFSNKKTILAENNKISRSEFLIKAGIGAAAVPFVGLSWSIGTGAYDYQIKKVKLYLPNLPSEFHGITLAQISDIHSGSFYHKKSVLGGVEMLLAQKPDFVFFTGDLVNDLASEMRDYFDIFNKIKAPLGVYSVLGNHDYGDYHFGMEPSLAKEKNLKEVKRVHKDMGWNLLLNEHKRIRINKEEIGILGIENWGAGRFTKYGKMDLAVQNTDDLPVKLLLSHDPSQWRAQVLSNYPQIDASFAGHTHGMQFGVRLKNYQWSPVQYLYKEWAGLYKEKHQQLYVNVGYGFLAFPGRLGILPEITLFELSKVAPL